jgi:hypothetical protein
MHCSLEIQEDTLTVFNVENPVRKEVQIKRSPWEEKTGCKFEVATVNAEA